MSNSRRASPERYIVRMLHSTLKALGAVIVVCAPAASFADDVRHNQVIDRWMAELQSDSFIQRDFAMRKLAELGEPIVPQLAQTVRGDKERAASAAVRLLERLAAGDDPTAKRAHRALAELRHQESELLDSVRKELRAVLLRADRRIIGIVIALGGSIERDQELSVISVKVNDRSFGDNQARMLSRLPSLMRLDLRETGVTDDSLEAVARLSALNTLNLSDTAVTAEGLRKLAPLQALRQLSVYRIEFSAEDLLWFREHLPACELRD